MKEEVKFQIIVGVIARFGLEHAALAASIAAAEDDRLEFFSGKDGLQPGRYLLAKAFEVSLEGRATVNGEASIQATCPPTAGFGLGCASGISVDSPVR